MKLKNSPTHWRNRIKQSPKINQSSFEFIQVAPGTYARLTKTHFTLEDIKRYGQNVDSQSLHRKKKKIAKAYKKDIENIGLKHPVCERVVVMVAFVYLT